MNNVIPFPRIESSAKPADAVSSRPAKPLSVFARNKHLRKERAKEWRKADRLTCYWKARWDLQFACTVATRNGVNVDEGQDREIRTFALLLGSSCFNLEMYREAFVEQMLTPAPTAAALAWKRRMLAKGALNHTVMKPEHAKCAIDTDAAWLEAHPTTRRGEPQAPSKQQA